MSERNNYGFFKTLRKRFEAAFNILLSPNWAVMWIDGYDGSLTFSTHNLELDEVDAIMEEIKKAAND